MVSGMSDMLKAIVYFDFTVWISLDRLVPSDNLTLVTYCIVITKHDVIWNNYDTFEYI